MSLRLQLRAALLALIMSACASEAPRDEQSSTTTARTGGWVDPRFPTELTRQTVLANMSAVVWGDGANPLYRWVSDIYLTLHHTEDDFVHDSIAGIVRKWEDVADLPQIHMIRLTESSAPVPETTNFEVVFVSPSEEIIRRLPGLIDLRTQEERDADPDLDCAANVDFQDDGTIKYALLLIWEGADFWDKRRCFLTFGLRALGLPRIYSGEGYTVFDPVGYYAVMTRQDEIMLRILYDARLSPGMELEAGLPIVEDIVSEFLPPD